MAKRIIDLAIPSLPLVGTELLELSTGGTLSIKVAVNEALTTLYESTIAIITTTPTGLKSEIDPFTFKDMAGNDSIVINSGGSVELNYSGTKTFETTAAGIKLNLGASTINEFSTDGEMAGDSDVAVPTEKAVKTYVDRIPILTSEPTGFPNRIDSIIGMDSTATNRFSIAPTGVSFDYYVVGEKYTVSGLDTIDISDDQGLHYIYYDGATLTESLVFDVSFLKDKAYVAVVYWDTTANISIYMGDERHGLVMDWATHAYLHNTRGTVWNSGLALDDIVADGTGNTNIDAQFGHTQGVIYDEDIRIEIAEDTVPAQIPIFYQVGNTGFWRVKPVDDFPVLQGGSVAGYSGTRLAYNEMVGANDWDLTEVADDGYVLMHYFATNDPDQPVVGVVGQHEYLTLEDAHNAADDELEFLILEAIPFVEFTAIATTINKTSNSFTNDPKSAIVSTDTGSDYIDWRGVQGQSRGSVAVSDHGNLTGLGDDDHTQYSLVTGSRGFIGTVDGIYPTLDDHLSTKKYVDDQIGGLTAEHNDLLGLQGGDATAAEFFHLTEDIYNGLFSGSPIIGIGSPTGSSVQVDYNVGGPVLLYEDGVQTAETFLTGSGKGIRFPGIVDNVDIGKGLLNDNLFIQTWTADSSITLQCADAGDVMRTAAFIKSNGINLYTNNNIVFQTLNSGVRVRDTGGSGRFTNLNDESSYFQINAGGGGVFHGVKITGTTSTLTAALMAEFNPDGPVSLYYSGDKVFETDSTGIIVLGDITLQFGTTINEFSIDGTLSGDSDDAVPTEKAVKKYVDTQIAGTNEHNELLDIQGGDSTAVEFYHLTKDIYDGLYSGSPIIGLGNVAGTNIEVDYGANQIYADVNGTEVLNMTATSQILGDVDDTFLYLNGSTNTVNLRRANKMVFDASGNVTDIYSGYNNESTDAHIQLTQNTIIAMIVNGSTEMQVRSTGVKLLNGGYVNEFSIDGTLVGDSDAAVPTEKAVKTYVDTQINSGLEAGNEPLSTGDTTAQIIFTQVQGTVQYSQSWSLENNGDADPSHYLGIVFDKTIYGFRVLFSGEIDSDNYRLSWSVVDTNLGSSSSSSTSSSSSSTSSSSASAVGLGYVMTSPGANPNLSVNDGYLDTNNAIFDNVGQNTVQMGSGNFVGQNLWSFYRWDNVIVPSGASIVSATVLFGQGTQTQNSPSNLRFMWEYADDAAIPTARAEMLARTYTDSLGTVGYVDWNNIPVQPNGAHWSTPELGTQFQYVIDRGGWSSGQAVMLMVKDNGSGFQCNRNAFDYRYSWNGSYLPCTLLIDYIL